MQSKLDELAGQTFVLGDKKYKVTSVKIVSGNAVIITDRRPFNLSPSEFDKWVEGIEIITDAPISDYVKGGVVPGVGFKPALIAEIVTANNRSSRMSEKLEAIFNELSGTPTEETYKKAKAMQDLSNSIVNVEMARYKYLTLCK